MVREHVQRMLRAVNLEGFIDRQTHMLSGGQKQRVAIAGALAQCPKVAPALPLCPLSPCHWALVFVLTVPACMASHKTGAGEKSLCEMGFGGFEPLG